MVGGADCDQHGDAFSDYESEYRYVDGGNVSSFRSDYGDKSHAADTENLFHQLAGGGDRRALNSVKITVNTGMNGGHGNGQGYNAQHGSGAGF